ncbi:MAG: twin-arginine translocation signal domain-containing protein [Caldilineaceae bacterium]
MGKNERMSRRNFLAWTAGLTGVTVLAACAAPAAAPGGEQAAGDAPAAAAADLRLTFWGDLADMPTWNWGSGSMAQSMATSTSNGEIRPGVRQSNSQTEVAGGTTPDVVAWFLAYLRSSTFGGRASVAAQPIY